MLYRLPAPPPRLRAALCQAAGSPAAARAPPTARHMPGSCARRHPAAPPPGWAVSRARRDTLAGSMASMHTVSNTTLSARRPAAVPRATAARRTGGVQREGDDGVLLQHPAEQVRQARVGRDLHRQLVLDEAQVHPERGHAEEVPLRRAAGARRLGLLPLRVLRQLEQLAHHQPLRRARRRAVSAASESAASALRAARSVSLDSPSASAACKAPAFCFSYAPSRCLLLTDHRRLQRLALKATLDRHRRGRTSRPHRLRYTYSVPPKLSALQGALAPVCRISLTLAAHARPR
jgi:hypothetical protein